MPKALVGEGEATQREQHAHRHLPPQGHLQDDQHRQPVASGRNGHELRAMGTENYESRTCFKT